MSKVKSRVKFRAMSAVWSTIALGTFMVLAWLGPRILPLGPLQIWVYRGVLALLALVTAFLVYRLTSASAPKAGTKAEPDPEDAVMDLAEKRLRASKGKKARPDRLPLVLLLGPRGGTKTTLIERAGIGVELLAGEVRRGQDVVPTAAVNAWYGQDTLFVEVADPVLHDEGRRKRLFRKLRPARLGAALGRGEQAPRQAVVCFSCEGLRQAGGAREAAEEIRQHLLELSQTLGIRLPVYVVFTKADRLPNFTEFVRNLTDEEAQEILGTTLTVPELAEPGDHVPRETVRLQAAFDVLFRSLARRRLAVLDREHQGDVRLGAYELPREFQKITDAAVQFLVELCRPTQLGVSPFLRGFYFTGVRPVYVRDTPAAAPVERTSEPDVPVGATAVFDPSRMMRPEPTPRAAQGEGRRVPQWVFLERIFRRIVLGDDVARAVTAGGRRVEGLRRLLVGAAAVLLLVVGTGMTWSYFRNRDLVREATAVIQDVPEGGFRPAGTPTPEQLAALDRLREVTDRIGRWDRDDRPLGVRWGLWTGDAIHPELRRSYFDRFASMLWRPTRSVLVSNLRGLPPEPGPDADYGDTYDDLKAYLVATSYPERSTSEFMTPVLLSRWQRQADTEMVGDSLARLQFDFFARELPRGNPYDDPADPQLLSQARQYLLQFSGEDQLYQTMLAQVSARVPPVRFADEFPESADLVRSDVTIPGAFTAEGWELVNGDLESLGDLFSREEWVLGEGRAVSDQELEQVAAAVRERYRQEYVRHWSEYLSAASVVDFRGADDAAGKLRRLSSNQSPLLQLLFLASRNTDVDTTEVGPVFQPLHHVAPPQVTDRYITDSSQPYVDALGRLQASMEQLANTQGPGAEQAASTAVGDATAAEQEVLAVARAFVVEGPAVNVGNSVQSLLTEPIQSAERLARVTVPARARAGLNQAGASFCRTFSPVAGKFPFARGATPQATVEEVDAVFRPGSGALWRFYEETLSELLVRRGSRYEARDGAPASVSPRFLDFFNRMVDFSETLYQGDRGPALVFPIRIQTSSALPSATFHLDGRRHTFTQVQPASVVFEWDAERARTARITGLVEGEEVELVTGDPPGTWALFRLFQVADWESLGGGRYSLRWTVPGRDLRVAAELSLTDGALIFDRSFMAGLGCVSNVAR